MSIKSELKTQNEHTNSYIYACNDAQSRKILYFKYENEAQRHVTNMKHN